MSIREPEIPKRKKIEYLKMLKKTAKKRSSYKSTEKKRALIRDIIREKEEGEKRKNFRELVNKYPDLVRGLYQEIGFRLAHIFIDTVGSTSKVGEFLKEVGSGSKAGKFLWTAGSITDVSGKFVKDLDPRVSGKFVKELGPYVAGEFVRILGPKAIEFLKNLSAENLDVNFAVNIIKKIGIKQAIRILKKESDSKRAIKIFREILEHK